ncbi:MAG: serine/threonine protein kinase [Archangiaceae bacterium]|nr:serine/threonine protein kinase [Archangiaceae bacterium]
MHLDDNTVAAMMGGTLSASERVGVEQHIEACESCRQLIAAMLKGARAEQPLSMADTVPSTAPIAPAAGRRLGRYQLLEAIGAGGMGVVYAAYDPVLERKVALKLVRGDAAAAEVTERLLREGKSIAQLSHPNIVSVFDMGQSDGQVFVAMELVGGGSLKTWLRRAPRAWPEVLEKFTAAGQGLAAAHRAGLVHRDFKPENVLIGDDGRVRVTDFGLASAAGVVPLPAPGSGSDPADPRLTRSGAVLGTPAYMAPEQLRAREADARSDQFSFCVALWEALFGVRPFAPATLAEPLRFVEPPPEVRVPPWLRRALQRGLQPEPEQRYESMEALLAALHPSPARGGRRQLTLATSSVALLVLVGGTTWWVTRSDRLCTGAPERVRAVWNEPQAAGIAQRFAGVSGEDGAASWQLARPRLEAWFHEWAQVNTEACRATRVRGEQSDELLTRRMLCLDRRYAEARSLVQLFAGADAAVVTKAPEAVDALGGLHACSDTEALLAEVSPPRGAALQAQVDTVRALLSDAKARSDSGLYREALARATEAVQLARAVDYRPALAEALAALGALQERSGELKASEATLLEAIPVAEGAKADAVTAQAATHLMLVLGARQARYAEAHAWGKLAEGAIARIGGSAALQARLLETTGLVRYAEGQLSEAIDAHQKAVALLEKLEPDSLALADALNGQGAALRGARRGKEALAVLERSLQILLERVGPHSDLVATTRNHIANALMLDGRFDEALTTYRAAHEVMVKRLGPTHFRTVMTLNNIGVVLAEEGRYAEALPYFEQVLESRQATLQPTDAKTADAYANVGMLLVELERYPEAQARFEAARGILQGYPLDHFSQAEPLLGQAKVFVARGEAAKAVPLIAQVERLCEGKSGFRFDYTRARAAFVMGTALGADPKKAAQATALALAARAAFESFGAERFKRDLTEVDAWLAKHGKKAVLP